MNIDTFGVSLLYSCTYSELSLTYWSRAFGLQKCLDGQEEIHKPQENLVHQLMCCLKVAWFGSCGADM